MRIFSLTTAALGLAFACSAFAQSDTPAPDQTAPAASAVTPDETLKPSALWGTVITRAQFQPLTGSQRWGLYWRQAYGTPGPYFAAFGSAIGQHINNEPKQWGKTTEGYFKRVGDRFARGVIQDSVEAAGAAALQHEVRYVRCNCSGLLRRTGYAIGMNFATLNKNGHYVPHVSRVGAAFAAEYIGNTWMPPGYHERYKALRGVGLQLAFGSLFNTFREFSPEIKRVFKRK